MATVSSAHSTFNLKSLTDCIFFLNGYCKLSIQCAYRHSHEAASQRNDCHNWPASCRNVQCSYRHPGRLLQPSAGGEPKAMNPSIMPGKLSLPSGGTVSYFWDIENVAIPRGQNPFDIVNRIRNKLLAISNRPEESFACYCNSTSLSIENQLKLSNANVRIVHVPSGKPGAVDLQILMDLQSFERSHVPPATIVLISGDIDFVGKLSDLRHRARFDVIVIHNKPAKAELKATAHACFAWEEFTQPLKESLPTRRDQSVSKPTKTPLQQLDSFFTNAVAIAMTPSHETTRENNKTDHQCEICSNRFASVQALRQHQESKDHLFECPICKETYFTSEGRSQHQKSKNHHAKTYRCNQCTKTFEDNSRLKQHRQSTGHN
jgi:stress-induced morphogen